MPEKHILIDKANKESILIQWKTGFTEAVLLLHNTIIGRFDTKEELFKGKTFSIGADDTVFIQFSLKHKGFIIKKNGIYIDSSANHPKNEFIPLIWISGLCAAAFLFIGLLNYFHSYNNEERIAGIACWVLSLSLAIIPALIRKGIILVYYTLLILLFLYIFAAAYLFFYFSSPHILETLIPLLLVTMPALVPLILLIRKHKKYIEVCNMRAKENNFEKVLS